MIQGRWHGIESLEALENSLYSDAMTNHDNTEGMMIAARQYVMTMLEQLLGPEKMRHFEVVMGPSADNFIIDVMPIDDVGKMLYTGTERHAITGQSMPVGEGAYANYVNHPGTEGYGPEIDAIIDQAIMIAYGGSFV